MNAALSYATVLKSYGSVQPCKRHPPRLNNLRCVSTTRVRVTTLKDAQILSLCAILRSTNTDWPIIIDTIPLFQPLKPSTWVVPKFLIAISNWNQSRTYYVVFVHYLLFRKRTIGWCIIELKMSGVNVVSYSLLVLCDKT